MKRVCITLSILLLLTLVGFAELEYEDAAVLEGKYFNKAALYYELEEFGKAREYLKQCIKLKPEKAKYYYQLGLAYFNDGFYEEADRVFLKTVKMGEEYKDAAYFFRGLIRYDLGMYHKAKKYFVYLVKKQEGTNLGMNAQKMLDKIPEDNDYTFSQQTERDWGFYIAGGSERNENVRTEFTSEDTSDTNNYIDFNIYLRPSWWQGVGFDFAYSDIKYQKNTSANIVAKVFRFGSDHRYKELFTYDFHYSQYVLNKDPYFNASKFKLMSNFYGWLPGDTDARSGFFLASETKDYVHPDYKDYYSITKEGGIEQTFFGSGFLTSYVLTSQSESYENNYFAINHNLNWYWQFLEWTLFVTNWKYEYRDYSDYYGFTRDDIYTETMFGIRQTLFEDWEASLEVRNLENQSNVDFKEYVDRVTAFSLLYQY